MVITGHTIAYILLFCIALNFMNQFYALFLLFFAGIWFIVPMSKGTPKPAQSRLWILGAFAICYLAAFCFYEGFNFTKTVVVLSFWGMFFIGVKWKRTPEKCLTSVIVIVIGTACHCLLNLLSNFSYVASGTARSTIDFWIGKDWIITGQISLFILLAGAAYYVLFCVKFNEKPFLKTLLLVLLLGGLYYNLQMGNRTTVYASALSMLIGFFLNGVLNGKKPQLVLRSAVLWLIGIGLLAVLYELDLFGLSTWFENTAFVRRLDDGTSVDTTDMESRVGQITASFSQLLSVPWGGYQMKFRGNKLEFIHNAWLNIAYGYGTVTALLFFIFSVMLLGQLIRLIKSKIRNREKVLFSGMYVSVLCYLFLEPVCEAAPQIVSLLCFISGTVEQMLWQDNLTTAEELL